MGPLTRWDPVTGLARLRDDMNRMMEDFFGETGAERVPITTPRVPHVDVLDTDETIVVRAEMPGIDKEHLTVEAMPDALTLRADIREEREERRGTYVRHERRTGSFHRVIPLPAEVKPDAVTAHYSDGVLEITLPKTEQARAKQPVKVQIN
jgi:HSP20 family protein